MRKVTESEWEDEAQSGRRGEGRERNCEHEVTEDGDGRMEEEWVKSLRMWKGDGK